MKKLFRFCVVFLLVMSCNSRVSETKVIDENDYELTIASNQKALLILFPCFPCDIEHTKQEAKFLNDIDKKGISTLLLNYNRKLYLTDQEKNNLSKRLVEIVEKNQLSEENIYIGGFSSGGNIALLLGNELIKTKNNVQPKGVFVVDSPIDLEDLYNGSQNDIAKNVSKDAVEEGKFLIQLFDKELGSPKDSIQNYEYFSPYLLSKHLTNNIENLKNIKLRFYCEPDLEWQRLNRKRNYEDLNAFKLKNAALDLIKIGAKNIEFIETKNRGYRANGQKYPHTWNLVEQDTLVNWMLK
ncbi:hypothetical protein HXZ94_04735 [Empedobacter falsenii]|uniref:hypothetical protein n=1 Tax=Empedobacter falsenii TaxID=343874 RepID=UPI002575FDE3|nr:hypothetical protein [Empedobacter falsenii]MDM1297806.1 hypothetical protein [Empedobacter falsenii]MDM1317564.1 hypothetical protein [Empedobacter falsenii]